MIMKTTRKYPKKSSLVSQNGLVVQYNTFLAAFKPDRLPEAMNVWAIPGRPLRFRARLRTGFSGPHAARMAGFPGEPLPFLLGNRMIYAERFDSV
jgi:hypothetical protein